MNRDRLQSIFKKYIDNFEMINSKHNETYKWKVAQEFQKFDTEAEDFADMLHRMCKASLNLVDNAHQLPFTALVEYAKKDQEPVRNMFRKLYANEFLDMKEKQKTIDEFIESSERLRMEHRSDSRLYVNDQRSVMMYLFLRYPDSNFGYKASQAKSFADCIEFYEDWGPMTDFRMGVFARMCEQVIEEIRKNDAIMETHMSRFVGADGTLYPDKNLHILLLDIIYTSQRYGFYGDMTFDPINAKSRKLYFERVAKAKELAEKVERARADVSLLEKAKEDINASVTEGTRVRHRTFGDGVIEGLSGTVVTVRFTKNNEVKKLDLITTVGTGILSFLSDVLTQTVKGYVPVMSREKRILPKLKSAEDELGPYLEFLD